jgi:hypothetical protein
MRGKGTLVNLPKSNFLLTSYVCLSTLVFVPLCYYTTTDDMATYQCSTDFLIIFLQNGCCKLRLNFTLPGLENMDLYWLTSISSPVAHVPRIISSSSATPNCLHIAEYTYSAKFGPAKGCE